MDFYKNATEQLKNSCEMRLCGGQWIYCDGKCNKCVLNNFYATNSTETLEHNAGYKNP